MKELKDSVPGDPAAAFYIQFPPFARRKNNHETHLQNNLALISAGT
jgi:hypothetical protein